MTTENFKFLNDLDVAKPDEVLENGSKVYTVRCRHPFSGLDFIQTRRMETPAKAEQIGRAHV